MAVGPGHRGGRGGEGARGPLAGAVKVTVAPVTGLSYWSRSWTTSGLAKAVLTVALWGLPETMVKVSPVVLAVLVGAKFPVPVPGGTRRGRRCRRRRGVGREGGRGGLGRCCPSPPSRSFEVLEKVPEAPLDGAVKVTVGARDRVVVLVGHGGHRGRSVGRRHGGALGAARGDRDVVRGTRRCGSGRSSRGVPTGGGAETL